MATKYPIIMHRTFFKLIFANNENIGQTFLPCTFDQTLMLYKITYIERSTFKVTSMTHWFSKVLPDNIFVIFAYTPLEIKSNTFYCRTTQNITSNSLGILINICNNSDNIDNI